MTDEVPKIKITPTDRKVAKRILNEMANISAGAAAIIVQDLYKSMVIQAYSSCKSHMLAAGKNEPTDEEFRPYLADFVLWFTSQPEEEIAGIMQLAKVKTKEIKEKSEE